MAEDKKTQGLKSSDKGTIVPASQRKPTDRNNLHLSKADYIAKENKRKEKDAAVKKFAAGFGKEKPAPKPKPEPKAKGKGKGKK